MDREAASSSDGWAGVLRRTPLWQWLIVGVVLSEVLTLVVSYLVSLALWGEMPGEVLIVGIVDSLCVSLIVVGVLLLSVRAIKKLHDRLEQRNHELSLAISEIKTLQGILPICSFCKQVRNDEGYYEQIDIYVHEHADVDFSHTICPDCAREHYPDFFQDGDLAERWSSAPR
jgi:hypothetical protein